MKRWIFLFSCWASFPLLGQNHVFNGDFELGGPGIGFIVNGNGYSFQVPPYLGTTSPGNCTVTQHPELFNTTQFLPINDHTSGSGNMLVVDGGTTGGNQPFWQAGNNGGGVCGLSPGNNYLLSYWLHSVSTAVTNPATQADIKVLFTNASNVTVLTQPTLDKQGIEVQLQLDSRALKFTGDKSQLQQVLLNLMTNAIEAFPAKFEGVKNITVQTKLENDRIVMSVADNGVGISPEIEAVVFELLRTNKESGMGIGLWLSKTIIDSHQGSISFTTRVNQG
ncbi:MAG: sensor histidine kinase, partial [Flavobacteriia bacterium]|nr:sensor histidine kinase [Flavobacteriia bacterium]